ncbi:hypothetical protein Gdia_2021 [Gluconacetobacter diazotrophicus PA1 5]|uniref:helix-turn-helix transcriptional regulator n=1 Tax=Gluconacetobacter diazotrophicus TaxID=33996 RepID=UPI000173B25C|nr:helix-turn-helix transcriptional regulator [Gluconacetobacter diazotrophicus]ACI51781.1 hypothetical protein Gdia_2021 [Gluconacetobacter diazotrophicus PA1 5]
MRDIDILSPDEIRNSPYYVDFLNKYGCSYSERYYTFAKDIEYVLAGQRSLNYLQKEQKTSSVDIEFFSGHITNSLLLAKNFDSFSSIRDQLSLIYDRMNFGVCLVSDTGHVLFVNGHIRKTINDLFRIVDNRLVFFSSHNQKSWEKLVSRPQQDILETQPTGITAFNRSNGQKILARQMTLPDIVIDHLGVGNRCKMTFFYDLVPPVTDIVELLKELGLSLSEARLVQTMGETGSLKESALKLGISYENSRSSLKTVFSKLNIKNQHELAAIVTQLSLIA